MHSGHAPLQQLGQSLAPHLAGDPEALRLLVRFDDPECALALLARWRRGYVAAVVVVDQFEELFTLNPPEARPASRPSSADSRPRPTCASFSRCATTS